MSLLLVALVGVGCAESHGTSSETDSGPPTTCTADASSSPGFACVYGSGHVCGDALAVPECVGGVLRCPSGTVPESEAECWCYGAPPPGCTCAPRGWRCAADAGVGADASACPSDPASAEGTPCAAEGTSCGRCTDSCGWCNILACQGGVWTRLEVFPPPDPCTSFVCGPELRCQAETQYCEHILSDVGGWPDEYACRPLPEGCHGCDCMPDPDTCTQGSEGGLTVTYGGG